MRIPKWLPMIAAAGLVWSGCDEQPVSPEEASVRSPSTPNFAIGDDTAGESVSGAVYTSTETRDIVNANQYPAREDVYFNGGPSDPDNPKDAALLQPPEPYSGDSWFWIYQVTNPSATALLSEDPWYCRVVENRNGRFYRVPSTAEVVAYFDLDPTEVTVWYLGGSGGNKWQYTTVADGGDCSHHYGGPFSAGDAEENVSVQLFPYQNTPNNGGVYKAWATPGVDFQCLDFLPTIADFEGKTIGSAGYPNGEDCASNHGFVNAQSKTDNYKVEADVQKYPAEITVWKFHDANMNCTWDSGEGEVTGWAVDVKDPAGSESTDFTRFTYIAGDENGGIYSFTEEVQTGTAQTASYYDDTDTTTPVSCYPTANPKLDLTVGPPANNTGQQEFFNVYFGNVGLGSVKACKIYDADADGETDEGESGIEGWKFKLTGTQEDGTSVGPDYKYTGSDGCVTWTGLFPGDYTVEEILPTPPPSYYATGNVTSQDVTVTSSLDTDGETISGSDESVTFYNFCTTTVDFGTKGYWHNKNGLERLEWEFIDSYVNTLDPYDDPTPYFGACDEPFDGEATDGSDCPGSMDATAGTIWAAGTWQAEISNFLVDNNSDTQCEQLAQQLLAFIFNVEYEMGGGGAIITPDGPMDPFDMISDAIAIWQAGDAVACSEAQGYLEGFNSSDAVEIQSGTFCPFSYTD